VSSSIICDSCRLLFICYLYVVLFHRLLRHKNESRKIFNCHNPHVFSRTTLCTLLERWQVRTLPRLRPTQNDSYFVIKDRTSFLVTRSSYRCAGVDIIISYRINPGITRNEVTHPISREANYLQKLENLRRQHGYHLQNNNISKIKLLFKRDIQPY
jgi:hypothetical protein